MAKIALEHTICWCEMPTMNSWKYGSGFAFEELSYAKSEDYKNTNPTLSYSPLPQKSNYEYIK